nr:GNAT family N-acetyltransferase [uncultured Catonella sp.]
MENVELKIMSENDLGEMTELAEKSFLPEYNVTKVNLKEKLLKDSDKFTEGSFILRKKSDSKLIGFIGTKLSHSSLYIDTAWISIIAVDKNERHKDYGRLLVTSALDELRKAGVKKVVIGQEFHNFFSGIPNPNEGNIGFFTGLGFSVNGGSHYDLESLLTDNEKLAEFDTSPFTDEFEVKTYNNDYDKLMDFLNKEFPGRWAYEVDTAIKSGKDSSEIVLLWNKSLKTVSGFCMLTSYKDERGKKTGYGGLGPIGIAEEIRGRQVGNYLLRESLIQAVHNSINRVNIDWTILVKFYGQFGFEIKRTYKSAYKELV